MIKLTQNGFRVLGLIFIVAILYQMVNATVPRLMYSTEVLVSTFNSGEGDQADVENEKSQKVVTYAEVRQSKDITRAEFQAWCESEGGYINTKGDCIFTLDKGKRGWKSKAEAMRAKLSIWFPAKSVLSLSITMLGFLIYLLAQLKLIYHLLRLFSRFQLKQYLTYENLNDLRNVVFIFILIPTLHLIMFKDFRLESFISAFLALILYQFMSYGLTELNETRKEIETNEKSFI